MLRSFFQGVSSRIRISACAISALWVAAALSPGPASASSEVSESSWNALFRDLLAKYSKAPHFTELCPSLESCLAQVLAWPYSERKGAALGSLISRLAEQNAPELSPEKTAALTTDAIHWLNEKYGVLDQPLFMPLLPETNAGSYQTPGTVRFRTTTPKLPILFDPQAPSSIAEIHTYISRKWGGLDQLATPDHVFFSELGTNDTLSALQNQGFTDFFQVNTAYAMRGSKTLLALHPTSKEPHVVFYSFVSRDLYQHKLMQLATQWQDRFKDVRVLTSNNLRSWEVADVIVTRVLRQLPDRAIDDLVIGYPDRVEESLRKRGKFLESARVGDFATIRYYQITGKTGLPRTVALLTDVALRYFGKSALTLVKPFLQRGIDRVLFAGSAGTFDRTLPKHALVIPRSFHNLEESGEVSAELALDNDLFNLLPYGVSYSGKHLSLASPLVESQELVRQLREQDQMLTVDVEGSKIAQLIADHNRTVGGRVRFAAAFIVTDAPIAQGDPSSGPGFGLHDPDFNGKSLAKKNYVSALDLLWDFPGKFQPSNHTRLILQYFSQQLRQLQNSNNTVALAILYSELQTRLTHLQAQAYQDTRVSFGLIKGYRDLMRALDRWGITPLYPESDTEVTELAPMPALRVPIQQALLLQSLSRSATVSGGAEKRVAAARGAERAVQYLISHLDAPLTRADIDTLHLLLNTGSLPEQQLGKIRSFDYHPIGGPVLSSEQAFQAFCDWIGTVKPSAESALEAYLRLEQLHPYSDGNGRTAELVAQSLALRASGHPLVFPNRFDIDYILTLRRNGLARPANQRYLEKLVEDSRAFSVWLKTQTLADPIVSSQLDPAHGQVILALASQRRLLLVPHFLSARTFGLDREKRLFLPAKMPLPAHALVQPRAEYTATFQLIEQGCAGLLTPQTSSH